MLASLPSTLASAPNTLVAFADGVLGEFTKKDIEVPAGGTLDLGSIAWTPRREGRQVFEIGVPNRNGSEFAMGTAFRDPEVVLKYAKEFPKDIVYTVGESNFRSDWPYLHVPHNTDPDVKVLPFFGIMGSGRATPYRIRFQLDAAPSARAQADLRLAICGTAAPALNVTVNGRPAGNVPLQQTRDGVITRHGSHGIWYETDFRFDARSLRKGWNELTLTVMFGPRTIPGPLESLQGRYNAGQLAPDVPAWVISRGIAEFGWLASDNEGLASRRISFGPDNIRGDLYYPKDTPEGTKLPVVIWLHGYHFPLGYMWVYHPDTHPIPALVKEGFAVLAFDQTGFGSRSGESAPFYGRYPEWSRLGRMVTDVQDAVTALATDALVDPERISLMGFAMGGTVGLYAAALDGRIRNVVSVCGFTPMRSDTGADGLSGMTRYSHLYGLLPQLGFFRGAEERLPYDFEDLIAMTAPRGVLVIQPSLDRDADPAAVRAAVEHAAKVYAWEGAACRIGPLVTGPDGAPVQLELREPEDYGRLTLQTQIPLIAWLKEH